ncbi:TPA: AAA family ATPase [Streptococcus suis]
MKLVVDNIASVEHAEIEINGITVIAGHNGTGKSTISRSLFSMFSSYYDLYNKISKDRLKSINAILENYLSDIEIVTVAHSESVRNRRIPPRIIVRDLVKLVSDNLSEILDDMYDDLNTEQISQVIIDSIEEFNANNHRYSISNLDDFDLENVADSIEVVMLQPDISIFNQILTSNFKDEFHKQINNIYNQNNGKITLSIKNELLEVEVIKNEVTTDKLVNFRTDVVYIDDAAAVIDNTFANGFWFRLTSGLDHNSHLIRQMDNEDYETHTLRARVTDRLSSIFSQLENVIGMNSVNNTEEDADDKKLNTINYSSGMKTFCLIKMLLEKGVIRENGTLILDEPEVHLHPAWQLKFAEIIVLLQKEFGLHILINSHSPYLVEAIDIYSKRNETHSNVKYYLASDEIADVTDSIDEIYKQMYIPLNLLEELAEDVDD